MQSITELLEGTANANPGNEEWLDWMRHIFRSRIAALFIRAFSRPRPSVPPPLYHTTQEAFMRLTNRASAGAAPVWRRKPFRNLTVRYIC
ncbi:hypothetical protein EMPG_14479 [Blastomyces silverae]|uniref:Uncharacterized protein n=1 Tax=Blastomyces silverae TaxID=2060906 RepID=A0A0H1BF62_9EURO|nr:hypothetical protein EMPG_14479 [Blastomyces silverae]